MVSKYSVKMSKLAQEDLEEIYQYISNESKSTKIGLRVIKKIGTAILSLDRFPKRHQIIPSHPNSRRISVYSYSITYRIDEEKKEVTVVRIFSDYTNWND
jgi:toxin ParE1/3/4